MNKVASTKKRTRNSSSTRAGVVNSCDLTPTQLKGLIDLFLTSRRKLGFPAAIQTVADAAVDVFMMVDGPPPVTASTTSAVKALIAQTCEVRGVPLKLVMSRGPGSRGRAVRAVRRECMVRVAALGFGQSATGRFFRRGHSGVVSALRTPQARSPALALRIAGGAA